MFASEIIQNFRIEKIWGSLKAQLSYTTLQPTQMKLRFIPRD